MYTECPECQTTVRVTAASLKIADGLVRCDECGKRFEALEHVLDASPEEPLPDSEQPEAEDEDSKALLHTLDHLVGPSDIRLEDTGVEWRVLDEEEELAPPDSVDPDSSGSIRWYIEDSDAAADNEDAAAGQERINVDELRFDDNTPLPDDYLQGDEEPPAEPPEAPDDAGDALQPTEFAGLQVDPALGDADDWIELLDDVEDRVTRAAGSMPLDVEEELAAIHSELSGNHLPPPAAASEAPEEPAPPPEPAATPAADAADAAADEQIAREEREFAATMAEDPESLFDESSHDVETIILEGDLVRVAIAGEEEILAKAELHDTDSPHSLADTYSLNRGPKRRRTDPPGFGMIVAVLGLALLLFGQFLHASRESLSTSTFFNRTLGSVYRILGRPVTPQWDIKGWQFQTTRGTLGEYDALLTIFSRIVNRSGHPLPYPLVHVSLTDRWEEIIGSRVLEPHEYLGSNQDPSRPVAAGDSFSAVITIEDPSVEATGFKLNVCYRVSPGRVRCATEDFKD